jgi:hypothetical protein
MKKTIAAIAIISALSSVATAQAASFEGVTVGYGLGSSSADFVPSNETYFGSSYSNYGGSSLGQGSIVPRIDVSYSKAVQSNILLEGGLTYDFGSQKTASLAYDQGIIYDYAAQASIKNHISLYFAPAYVLNDTLAVFAKLSYNTAKETYSENYVADMTHTLNGTGYGFGFKYMANQNVVIKGEVEMVNYSSVHYDDTANSGYSADAKLSTTTSTVTMAYKF